MSVTQKHKNPVSLAVTMTQKSFSSSACDVALVVGEAWAALWAENLLTYLALRLVR